MSNIIDKIQVSGVTYTLSAETGGGGTVSSAITSGDTNAVAGGAVYDKFDEVEQVTARALIDLDTRIIDLSGSTSGSGISSGEVQTMIDESISGKLDTSVFETYSGDVETALGNKQDTSGMTAYTEVTAFTAHTGDSTIHVTSSEKQTWNAKSDFSGSYNDLSNKPTIPTVTNTITSGSTEAISSGAVYDAIGDIETLLSQI